MRSTELEIVSHNEVLTRKAAGAIVQQMAETLERNTTFSIALSGGSTPRALYSLLADEASFHGRVPWDKVHFFWGDERHVPPDHSDSNYRMANEAMLSKVPVPPENIHRVRAEEPDANKVAEAYELELMDFFQLEAGQPPRFDCVLLGMGPDGHTASLFPGTEALHEHNRLVAANWVEEFSSYRITMTVPVLNNADIVMFLVSGDEKAGALREVLRGDEPPERFPAKLIRPLHGKLLWLVDQAAARDLTSHG
jgi:6-phosphogluconolactonase